MNGTPSETRPKWSLEELFWLACELPILAGSVSTDCKTGTSGVAASETFMKSRGMSELPPEAAVRHRALPPARRLGAARRDHVRAPDCPAPGRFRHGHPQVPA
jgi:hypothetical protein